MDNPGDNFYLLLVLESSDQVSTFKNIVKISHMLVLL